MVDGDAHGRRVPEASLLVPHGRAVARAGQEAAGLVGIRIVFRQPEGTERALAHIDAVGIGVVLCAGRGVLEIILPLMLVHPRALDIGLVREHPADQGAHVSGKMFLRYALGFHKSLILRLDRVRGSRQRAVVLADALVADFVGMVLHNGDLFGLRKHRLGIELDAPDRRLVGAAPVKIHAPVVIEKEVRIPEREAALELLIGAVQDILRTPAVAVVLPVGGTEVYPVPDHAHVRRVVVERQIIRQAAVLPVHEIVRDPDAQRHGGEDVVASLEEDHRGIGRLAADLQRAALAGVGVELVAVVDVDGITIILHSDTLPCPRHVFLRSAARCAPEQERKC